tara:strand:+ start:16540 stop:17121 length:582 start_codon:yes stop_codon:yes gene_type:complete
MYFAISNCDEILRTEMPYRINDLFIEQSTLISTVDGGYLVFSKGKFDHWCIYYVKNKTAHAIKDVDVFHKISCIGKTKLKYIFYKHFCRIFELTNSIIDKKVIQLIHDISIEYPNASEAKYIFLFLYAGMVAEENKRNAIIKKYMKRLGVHQVIIENMRPEVAANYSKGKSWRGIFIECEVRGFAPNCLHRVA